MQVPQNITVRMTEYGRPKFSGSSFNISPGFKKQATEQQKTWLEPNSKYRKTVLKNTLSSSLYLMMGGMGLYAHGGEFSRIFTTARKAQTISIAAKQGILGNPLLKAASVAIAMDYTLMGIFNTLQGTNIKPLHIGLSGKVARHLTKKLGYTSATQRKTGNRIEQAVTILGGALLGYKFQNAISAKQQALLPLSGLKQSALGGGAITYTAHSFSKRPPMSELFTIREQK